MVMLYPAIFTPIKNGTAYSVKFPDFPESEIISEIDDYYFVYLEAQGWLYERTWEWIHKGIDLPYPSSIYGIQAPKEGFSTLVYIEP